MSIALTVGIAGAWMFTIVILIQVLRFEKEKKANPATRSDAWLFSNFNEKLYHTFTEKKPEEIAPLLKINVAQYYSDCSICGKIPDLLNVVVFRVMGLLLFLISLCAGFLDAFFCVCGCAYGGILMFYPVYKMHSEAEQKKDEFEACIPRYLDLLQACLEIHMPIEQAIRECAESLHGLLSEELLEGFGDVALGASNWREALEDIAYRYQVPVFSDLVLDIVTAYEKGVDILEPVSRKRKDYSETFLLAKKERMAKVKIRILLPTVLFKILPLLGFLLIPVIMQLQSF